MDAYSTYTEYPALSIDSGESSPVWSSAGEFHSEQGLPAYSSHILNFDPAPAVPRTLFTGDHYAAEPASSCHSPYSVHSPYASGSPYAHTTINSPFISAHQSPFLSQHPLDALPVSHSPPPLTLEPLATHWQSSGAGEVFVNVSDLTSSSDSTSSGNSPTNAFFYNAAVDHSTLNYGSTTLQQYEYLPPRDARSKRKRPSSPVKEESYDILSPSNASSSSYHDETYSDADSLYLPSPGHTPKRKRARVAEEANYQYANDGKKSRGRKVPVAPDFDAEVGEEIKTTRLASIPYGVKKAGAPNKNKRRYVCTYEGCGKCFVRGEHLKRHVKSLHLCEKPHQCPYAGCKKSFSRKDNLKQHMGIFH